MLTKATSSSCSDLLNTTDTMQKPIITFFLIAGTLLFSCTGTDRTASSSGRVETVTHNVAAEQLEGEWVYKDAAADIEINIPGMQEHFRSMLEDKLKTELQGTTIIYTADHKMFLVRQKDTVAGRYKIEDRELVHYDFGSRENIMNYANAHMEGNQLRISVSEAQFDKMLAAAGNDFHIPEEARKIFKMKGLTYTFEKTEKL